MGLLEALKGMIPKELIEGVDVEETAKFVDLSVAYTPVVREFQNPDPATAYGHPPRPVKVVNDGLRYCIMDGRMGDYQWVDVESLKVMRARYLLLRGMYYRRLNSMGHQEREQVLAYYFPDGAWTPQEGSPLAKAMGMA